MQSPSEGDPLALAAARALVTSPQPLLVCSLPGGEIRQASRSAASLLGLSPDELVGQPLSVVLGMDPPPVWHDADDPPPQTLSLPSGQFVDLSCAVVPACGGTLGLARLTPPQPELLARLVARLPVALRLQQDGKILFANDAAAALPQGKWPPGDLGTDGRDWMVEHVQMEGLTALVASDVSRLARQAREESERLGRFELMLSAIEDFVGIATADERRLFVSPSFYRVTGYSPEEVVSTDFRTRVHPDDLELVEKTRAANLRGEQTRIEYRCRCRDGSFVWLDLRALPLPGPDGRIERIVWASRDVSDRKRLEQELRDSRRFIEQVADAIPQMLFVYDLKELRHVWVNGQCKAVRGYTPGELLRMKSGESLEQIHPEDRLEGEVVMRRVMAASEGEVVQWLYRIRHPERGWRRLRTRCLVFRHGEDGLPWQVLGVSEDVTDEQTPSYPG